MIAEYRSRVLDWGNGLRWPIRLRLLLLLPGSWPWNRWIRNFTARLEGFASYEDEITDPDTDKEEPLQDKAD